MRTKATLFLLVLVAGLGAFAYFTIRPGPDPTTPGTGADLVDLDRLEIAFRDQPAPVVLERKQSGWEIASPVRWPANFYAVDRLLRQLQFIDRENSFPIAPVEDGGQPLSEYGLDPPEGIITCGRREAVTVLQIGKATDLGNRLYLRRQNEDRVLVVGHALLASLRMDLAELRSPAVFTLPVFEVRSWNVQIAQAGNLRVWLSRDGDRWRIDTPVRARADKAAVETLLNRILGVTVVSFVRDGATDPTLLGLATPDFRITVEGPGKRESLLIGGPVPASDGGEFYAQREEGITGGPPTVFTVRIDFAEELRNAQLGLRDRRVVDIEPQEVQSIGLAPAGNAPITLQKLENGLWQVVSREGDRGLVTLPGDTGIIDGLVREIAQLRAVEKGGFVSDAPMPVALENYGLTLPAWQLAITEAQAAAGGSQPRTHTLMLGAAREPGGPLVYARVAEEGFVYLVDRGLADDLSPEPHHYRDRELQKLPEGKRITALSLRNLGTNETVLAVSLAASPTWEEALAAEPEQRRQAILALLAELRDLRAGTIVAPHFSATVPGGENKAWTWLLEATVTVEGGASPQLTPFELHLDSFSGGTQLLGASVDLNLVFTASQSFIDAFSPLVLRRADPGPPPAGAGRPPGADTPADSGGASPATVPPAAESPPASQPAAPSRETPAPETRAPEPVVPDAGRAPGG